MARPGEEDVRDSSPQSLSNIDSKSWRLYLRWPNESQFLQRDGAVLMPQTVTGSVWSWKGGEFFKGESPRNALEDSLKCSSSGDLGDPLGRRGI